jgi:hypothetical protein
MWQHIDKSNTPAERSSNVITEFPENPEDQFEILSIENDTVIAYHCNGRNVLLAFGNEDLKTDKWWMKM